MSPDTVDALIQQTQDRPSSLGRALETEAQKQAEYDSRRRPLFDDARRQQAAVYEEKSLHQSITNLGFLPSDQAPTDRFSSRAAQENGPARGVSGGESDESLPAHPRLAVGGQATADQSRGVAVPYAAALDLIRTAAAHAGPVDGLNQSQPTWAVGTAIAKERHDLPLENLPDREAGNDPIAQFAPKYTATLHGQLERIVSARETPARDGGFTKALIDTLTPNQVHPQVETGADEREFLLLIGQGEQRVDPSAPYPTVDRAGGWKSDDDPSPGTAANGSVQEAMAAAAGELERLRTAVRRTIDELERVRGSVQPPLPALPVNRGTFRLS